MRRLIAAASLAAALWTAAAASGLPNDGIFAEVDRIVGEIAKISGLQARRKVPCELIGRGDVNAFLKRRVKESATPEEIRAEELTLRKFGLVPPGFDLAGSTVDLLTEQAAAFYDFHRKRLYISDTTPSAAREAALVHELAHAVADQNFNLERFLKDARKSDDGALARMAVMEGQATWLMSEYLARRMGQSLETTPSLVDAMTRSTEAAAGQFPVFETAPLYMKRTLIFPYTGGMLFQQKVVERQGKEAFAAVFRRAPASTRQILHPDEYFAGSEPVSPALPRFPAHGYKELTGGSFGELDHSILIEQFIGREESGSVAPHWRGGQYKLWEDRERQHQVLAYASEWDSAESAGRYFVLYRQVLRKKWKKMDVASESATRVSGTGDDGYFVLEYKDRTVSSLEGLQAPPAPALH